VISAGAFVLPKFQARQRLNWWLLVGEEAHFLVVVQEAELENMLLEAFCMESDGRGSEREA